MIFLLRRVFWSVAISTLPLLKHIYGSRFMSRSCRTLQKSIPSAAVPKNAAINPMYIGDHRKRRNRQHIVAVFVLAAKKSATIVLFFCSVSFHFLFLKLCNSRFEWNFYWTEIRIFRLYVMNALINVIMK